MNSPCDNCTEICPGSGCTEWRDWFTQNWNRNIHRKVTIGLTGRQVLRYEHPDRIREMVAEMGHREVEDLMRGNYLTPAQYLDRIGRVEGDCGPELWEEDGDDSQREE